MTRRPPRSPLFPHPPLSQSNLTPFTRQHQSVNLNKFGAMTSLTEIICSGVLERYPRLKVVLSEIQVGWIPFWLRSEEHTSELQSPCNLVCRLLLEKKNQIL